MREDFITVATFADPATAYLANQDLEAAGIRGYIADENMDPIFGHGVGWVKLLVARQDAVRAVAVLEAKMPPPAPPSEDIMLPEDRLTSDEPFGDDPDDEPEEQGRRKGILLDEKVTPEPDEGGERSRLAERAFRASLVGLALCSLNLFVPICLTLLLVCPIALYACFALLEIGFAQGQLTARARWRLTLAVPATLVLILILFLIVQRLLSLW
jgi:hypothetical protein